MGQIAIDGRTLVVEVNSGERAKAFRDVAELAAHRRKPSELQTPMQAMKTAEGREMVEALFRDLERRPGIGPGIDEEILSELRATLSSKRPAASGLIARRHG